MTRILKLIEQFLALFSSVKVIAGEPTRLNTFYSESSAIRDAAEKLTESALDLEYHVKWFGPKRIGSVASGFGQAWEDCQERWAPAIAYASFCEHVGKEVGSLTKTHNPYSPDLGRNLMQRPRAVERPDPERDEFFDPVRHDGGSVLELGIDHWRSEIHDAKFVANKCQLALEAFDYLSNVVGVDVFDIFRRWREIPHIFVPCSVLNAGGEATGSLSDLLDNAVRAYVCKPRRPQSPCVERFLRGSSRIITSHTQRI